jgi:hypothetical protein
VLWLLLLLLPLPVLLLLLLLWLLLRLLLLLWLLLRPLKPRLLRLLLMTQLRRAQLGPQALQAGWLQAPLLLKPHQLLLEILYDTGKRAAHLLLLTLSRLTRVLLRLDVTLVERDALGCVRCVETELEHYGRDLPQRVVLARAQKAGLLETQVLLDSKTLERGNGCGLQPWVTLSTKHDAPETAPALV